MSGYPAPWEQKWAADQATLLQDVATLKRQMTQVASIAAGLAANAPQLLTSQSLAAPGPINLAVPAGAVFTSLRVIWAGASNFAGTATYMYVRLNNDSSSSDYTWQFNQASGTTQSSQSSAGTDAQIRVGTLAAATGTAGYLGSGEFLIPYAAGGAFKTVSGFSNSQNSPTGAFSGTYGGQWLSTAAVTSIQMAALSGSLIAGSTAYLYGMPE